MTWLYLSPDLILNLFLWPLKTPVVTNGGSMAVLHTLKAWNWRFWPACSRIALYSPKIPWQQCVRTSHTIKENHKFNVSDFTEFMIIYLVLKCPIWVSFSPFLPFLLPFSSFFSFSISTSPTVLIRVKFLYIPGNHIFMHLSMTLFL